MIIYNSAGIKILEVTVDDNSYRHRAIMGDNNLTLYFALAEHTEIPIGAYCDFQGERYTLMRPEALKMRHSRYFEYTVTLESAQAKSKIWKFRNPVDGRLKFSLTAKPREHLQMFVDNMNRRDTGWTVGSYIDAAEKCISYDHDFCWDALCRMASEFKTEFEIKGKVVSIRKVEYNKSKPLALSYGRGKGFKPDVGRSNYGDTPPIEILYTQGGNRNIDRSKYGASELHLPINSSIGYDGEKFEDETGFDANSARYYCTDDLGMSIRRTDNPLTSLSEDSLDCSEIYPKRVGIVGQVITVDADKHFYDFTDKDSAEDPCPNYEDYLIAGETMTVIFQTGMLAGREFEVKYHHEPTETKLGRRFEIVPQEIDGELMPNETFKPSEVNGGDEFVVYKCYLPQEYINTYNTVGDPKRGAEWDMFREGVKYLYDHEEQDFSFSGTLDGIWAKKDWVNIGGYLVLGGYILFSDDRFQREGVLVRIIGIKDYINNPHSPELELSNSTVSGSIVSSLKTIQSQEVTAEENHQSAIQFAKRRFRDAQETLSMLEGALLDKFSNGISPITVQTMSALVGDESLQFRFVDDTENPTQVVHQVTYDQASKQLRAEEGILQHMTLGIKSLSSQHATRDYHFWYLSEFLSGAIDEPTKGYYLYAKCEKDTEQGEFVISETSIKMDAEEDYYYFLVGVLNSEYDVERSYVSLYGFTEILPSRVTTDRVVSGDGNSYFDMVANAMKLGDVFSFRDGKLRLRGTIVQSQSGEENYIGCYRGVYDDNITYYQSDEVSFSMFGVTSTYRQINESACTGIPPTNSQYWQVVAQGQKGESGNYTELRFHVSGSPTSDNCAYNVNEPFPHGWSVESPTVPTGSYLWMISAVKDAERNLVTPWSNSVRITGERGEKGEDGKAPAAVYRGEYDPDAVYYGTGYRVDVVKLGAVYYVAQTTAGSFSGVSPADTSVTDKWNSFGASFDSVATQLLLAEFANLAGFIFKNNLLISQRGSVDNLDSSDYMNERFVPNISIDAVNGIIKQGETLTIDRAGVTIHKPNGEMSAQIVDAPIGSYADLVDSNGAFVTFETIDTDGWMAHEVCLPNQLLNGKTYNIGRLSKNSRIEFSQMNVVIGVGYAIQDSTSVPTTITNTHIDVLLLCDGRIVKNLGSATYTSSVGSGDSISHLFEDAQTIIVDGNTYPEGNYTIQVVIRTTIYCSAVNAYWHVSTFVAPNISYQKNVVRQTLIGNDGMYSCWGSNVYMYASRDGHYLRFGNNILKVDDSGIFASNNGGPPWKNLTS